MVLFIIFSFMTSFLKGLMVFLLFFATVGISIVSFINSIFKKRNISTLGNYSDIVFLYGSAVILMMNLMVSFFANEITWRGVTYRIYSSTKMKVFGPKNQEFA